MTDRETLVLRSYYCNHPALRRFLDILRPDHFREPGSNMLFTVLQHYYREYGRTPGLEEATLDLRAYRGPKQHEEDSALELLKRCEAERSAEPEPRWLERQVYKFIDDAETARVVMDFVAAQEKQKDTDEETTSDILLRQVTQVYDLREVLTQRPLAGLGFGDAQYVWEKFNSPQQRFLTGLPSIDELTNGGLARGQVGVVAAGSGVGKSMALCHLAAEAARRGAGVLYLNCESEDYELQARIISNLADMRNDRYRSLEIEGLREAHARCAPYRVVVRDLLTSSRPTDISTAVEEFRFKYGQHPDLIVVDYLNELEPAKENKNDTSYSSVARTLKDLMKLAKRTKSALWTAVQFNREGLKRTKKGSTERPDATHIAESISILFKATLVLTMNLLENDDPDVGYLGVSTEKYRFNSARPELVIKLEYQYARLTELSPDEALAKRIQAARTNVPVDVKKPGQMPSQWVQAMAKKRADLCKLKV